MTYGRAVDFFHLCPCGRWHQHGTRPDTLVLIDSIEEGPLAEIVCAGDVDPARVLAALNDARRLHLDGEES